MSEPNATTRAPWLRWALTAILLGIGLALFLWYAPSIGPLIQLGAGEAVR